MVVPTIYIASMPRKLKKSQIKILILIVLQLFITVAAQNMLIPSYSLIAANLGFRSSLIYVPDSLFILAVAVSSIVWGYFSDKIERNRVIVGGGIVSIAGFVITILCQNYWVLLLGRIISGIGGGPAIPIGYSMLMDIVKSKDRNGWFGFLAVFSSVSNGAGNAMGGFLTPLNIFGLSWRFSFILLCLFSVVMIAMVLSIQLPRVGAFEDELAQLKEHHKFSYNYHITHQEFFGLIKKKSNLNLFLGTFFAIIPGTMVIFLIIDFFSDPDLGLLRLLPDEIRIQVSSIVSSLLAIGFIIGIAMLSNWGDKYNEKDRRSRAKFAFLGLIIAVPALIIMLTQAVPISEDWVLSQNYPELIPHEEVLIYTLHTIISIFKSYPQYIIFLFFAYIGTFCAAAPVAAKNAVIVDANLPEHRGTSIALLNSVEKLGNSLTLMVIPLLFRVYATYQFVLMSGVIFYIPACICWYFATKHLNKDFEEKDMILKERAQSSLIDHFFELEIATEKGIRMVEYAKTLFFTRPKKAEAMLDQATKRFRRVLIKAEKTGAKEVEKLAFELMEKSLAFKSELLSTSKKPTKEQILRLTHKMGQFCETSDCGIMERKYEEAYLRICEARTLSQFDPYKTMDILDEVVEVYKLILRFCGENLSEMSKKTLSYEEQFFQNRVKFLQLQSQKSRDNTKRLKMRIQNFLKPLYDKGLTDEQLKQLTMFNEEYEVDFPNVVNECFDEDCTDEFKEMYRKLRHSFKAFDRWQAKTQQRLRRRIYLTLY